MPRKDENVGSEAEPHFDGMREGIINDSTGVQFGLRSDVDSENIAAKKKRKFNDDLRKFEEMTRGKPVD